MIKTLLISVALMVGAALMCGCEWTAGGNVDTWNTSQSGDWTDFSGTYKAAATGVLVQAYAGTVSTNVVTGQQLDTGDGTRTAFSGNLGHSAARGTLTIIAGAYRFTDSVTNAGTNMAGTVDLTVSPADGSKGTFNFSTFIWTLSFPAPIASGTPIVADYSYFEAAAAQQGNHGKPIYSFVVFQLGNKLQIIDSNNARYDGTIGSIRETGALPTPDEDGVITHSGPIEAQFSATGISQGYKVTIVGVLQGTISGSTLSERIMNATFIEEGGYQADIMAKAK